MPRISVDNMDEVERALQEYFDEVSQTEMSVSTKNTYTLHAQHFVRSLKEDFKPGGRVDGRGKRVNMRGLH